MCKNAKNFFYIILLNFVEKGFTCMFILQFFYFYSTNLVRCAWLQAYNEHREKKQHVCPCRRTKACRPRDQKLSNPYGLTHYRFDHEDLRWKEDARQTSILGLFLAAVPLAKNALIWQTERGPADASLCCFCGVNYICGRCDFLNAFHAATPHCVVHTPQCEKIFGLMEHKSAMNQEHF